MKQAMEKGGAHADELDAAECGGLTCAQVQECLRSVGVPPIPASLAKILPGRYPKLRYRIMRKSSIRTGFDAVRRGPAAAPAAADTRARDCTAHSAATR